MEKVLLIEDNKEVQLIYQTVFTQQGFEVVVRDNALEALVDIADVKPQVVVCDIMMPDMDGYEFLRRFKENTSLHMPIVMCSNVDETDAVKKCMDLGADEYFTKATKDPYMLGEELKKIIEKKKQK